MSWVIEVKDVVKKYPGVVANNNVNLQVEKGKIHAIIGENGAGKSTLMKILLIKIFLFVASKTLFPSTMIPTLMKLMVPIGVFFSILKIEENMQKEQI